MVGLMFQFGGAPVLAKVEPVSSPVVEEVEKISLDSDHDGIFDSQDKCPGTPAGVRVDKEGCPADTDCDGVMDYRDACVDTPKGTELDMRGCPKEALEVVTLSVKLLFGLDKDQVNPFHYSELKRVADFTVNFPTYPVVIKEHADDLGLENYNLDLSHRRANNVRNALVNKYGVAADRISVFGFGETQPVADNTTVEGRKMNRRVEIEIQP
jgi:OOP family OmpA-OmpF porin